MTLIPLDGNAKRKPWIFLLNLLNLDKITILPKQPKQHGFGKGILPKPKPSHLDELH